MTTHRAVLFAAAFAIALAPAGLARAETEKTSLALPTLTVTFMPVYIAKDLGFWEKLGLDVSLHDITGIGATNAMLAGSVDFTVHSGETLIRGNMRGQKMQGVALMAQGVAFEITMTKQAAGKITMAAPLVERAQLLKGKTISMAAPKTVVDGFLRYIASKADLNHERDYKVTYMLPPAALAALRKGDIDAAALNFPWTKMAQTNGAVLVASGLTDVSELLPAAATSTSTRADFCKQNRSICVKLVKGYVQAHAYVHANPEGTFEVARKRMPKTNLQDLRASLDALRKDTPRVPAYSEIGFKHAQELMLVGGMIRKDEMLSSFSDIHTNEFVNLATRPGS
jgi:NitT/TauT family transport system substrate-binding protein